MRLANLNRPSQKKKITSKLCRPQWMKSLEGVVQLAIIFNF